MVAVQQNASALRALEEKAEQLLLKARLPMGQEEVRDVAELLEKMLDPRYPIDLRTRRRCFRGLVKLCGQYRTLPRSHVIPQSEVEKLGDEPIYSGEYSEVWPGVYEGETDVAIKVIRYYGTDDLQTVKKNFCREVITWKRLSHPNILELIGVTMNNEEFAMVSKWMDYGNIMHYVRDYPETNALKLLEDAACGLQYLHSVELAHGDLKGANIMIHEDGRACLTDVGFTRVASDLSSTYTTDQSKTEVGCTMRWSAPELRDPERYGLKKGGPTKKTDIYSMAMTIYEVLTDKVPFYGYKEVTVMGLLEEGARPEKPNFILTRGYTEELWDLTVSCWNERFTDRPSVDYVLERLKVAAERWEPPNGDNPPLFPEGDWNQPPSAESDSPTPSEREDQYAIATGVSDPPPNPPVTETPVPAATPSASQPSLPVASPIAESEVSPEYVVGPSYEEKIPSVATSLVQEEDSPSTAGMKEMKSLFVEPPRCKDQHVIATDVSDPPPPHPTVTEAPVPAATPSASRPSLPVSSRSLTESEVSPEYAPASSDEDKIPSAPTGLVQEEDFSSTARRKEMETVLVEPPRPPRQEVPSCGY